MQVQSEDEDDTPGPEVQRDEGVVVGSPEDTHLAAIASLKAKQVFHSRKSVSYVFIA